MYLGVSFGAQRGLYSVGAQEIAILETFQATQYLYGFRSAFCTTMLVTWALGEVISGDIT